MEWLQSQPAELVAGLTLLACYGVAGLMGFFFGSLGLVTYMTLAVIVGNLQVFKVSPFELFDAPVALGTGVFVSLGVVTDLITEVYGPSVAKKGVWLSFLSFLGMTGLMLLTVGSAPVSPLESPSFWELHQHLDALFRPLPAFLGASMVAYLVSEWVDIGVFSFLKKRWGEKSLGGRGFLATAFSGFIDNAVFSVLAWIVFAPHPLKPEVVFQTYIWGTYLLRLAMTGASIPCLYGLRSLLQRRFPAQESVR